MPKRVRVLNTIIGSGRVIVEGEASIVRWIDRESCRAIVRFDGERDTYERFIDPDAQGSLESVEAYLRDLNRCRTN